MTTRTITIPNLEGEDDVRTIETKLEALPGISGIGANAESKEVKVQWAEPATWEKIVAALKEIGYPPARLEHLDDLS